MICDWWISIRFVCFCVSRFVACDRNYDWRQRKTQLWRRLMNFRVRMFVKSAVSEHSTTESTLLEEEALFEFFLPKNVLWLNVMISCYALSCWSQFCILTDSTKKNLGAKGFSFFRTPDSSRRGLFAKKCSRMICFVWHSRFAWQYLVWPGTVIQVSRTGNSFYPVDF